MPPNYLELVTALGGGGLVSEGSKKTKPLFWGLKWLKMGKNHVQI